MVSLINNFYQVSVVFLSGQGSSMKVLLSDKSLGASLPKNSLSSFKFPLDAVEEILSYYELSTKDIFLKPFPLKSRPYEGRIILPYLVYSLLSALIM